LIVALLGCGFVTAWAWPKTALDAPSGATAEYRGFQSALGVWLLEPHYYRLHRDASDDFELGWYDTTVELNGPDYNPFSARYPDGSLAARGSCRVTQGRSDSIPMFDPKDIKDAEFYKPDCTLVAKVSNGTGLQMHYRPNGQKDWEIEVREFRWVHNRSWYANGQLAVDDGACDRASDGQVVGYHDNGNKDFERTYVAGKLVGPSKRYDSRGILTTIEYYDPPGKLKRAEHYDDHGKLVRTEKP
jgi:hypothetical protein